MERERILIPIPDTPNNYIANLIHNSSSTNQLSSSSSTTNGAVVGGETQATSSSAGETSSSSDLTLAKKRQKIDNSRPGTSSREEIEMQKLDHGSQERVSKPKKSKIL